MSGFCNKCHRHFYHRDTCNCIEYKIIDEENYGDEPQSIYAHTQVQAAMRWSEKINGDEPIFDTDIFQTPIEVIDQAGVSKKFRAQASISIDYSVDEVE